MSSPARTSQKARFIALIGLAAGLTAFDETSLGVALPTLRHEFDATASAAHWVVNAYLLVMASLVAASGRLADFIPADRLWRFGLAVFAVMSIAAALTTGIGWLIAARAFQGVGAALIFTSSVALIGQVFPDSERGRAFGIFSSVVTILLIAGPIAGGLLTEYLSWRWLFWITVPPALFCLWGLRLPGNVPPQEEAGGRFDVPGMVAQILSVATLTVALMQGAAWGWTSPAVLVLFTIALISGIAFVRIEAVSDSPLIDLSLFRNASVAASLATVFLAQYRRVGTSIYLALFLRDGLGLSPFMAGLALLPTVALLPLSTVVIGRAADRFGARPVVLTGIAVIGLGTAWIALATHMRSYFALFPALVLISLFAPSMFGPSRKAMMSALPPSRNAQLSGVSVTAQMFGSTLAISIGSVLLSMTGAAWPIFIVMAAASAALWLFAHACLGRT